MDSRKPLYQPWNEEEFQSDLHVRKMNSVQRWIYRTLLQAMFFHTTRPYLPINDDLLWMLADCRDRAEWFENKPTVMKMFYVETVNGQEMFAHRRVLKDWTRLEEKREALAERGRSGGLAKGKRQPTKEVKGSEVIVSEVKESEADMSAFKERIGKLAYDTFKVTVSMQDPKFTELSQRAKLVGGQDVVVDAFAAFCADHAGDRMTYPLGTFLNSLDGYVEATETDAPDSKPLIHDLAFISNGSVTFDRKQSSIISRLLDTYSADEVKSAFREFYAGLDDFTTKFGAKHFVEKAEQFLVLQRRRAEELRKTDRVMKEAITREQAQAALDIAEADKRRQDEAAFFDPLLDTEMPTSQGG